MAQGFDIGGEAWDVFLTCDRAGGYVLHGNDGTLATRREGDAIVLDGVAAAAVVIRRGDELYVHLDGRAHVLTLLDPVRRHRTTGDEGAAGLLRAPMPGAVVSVMVAPGQTVRAGEPLIIIESMKLETTIVAPQDGTVSSVNYGNGQIFERGALLISLTAEA